MLKRWYVSVLYSSHCFFCTNWWHSGHPQGVTRASDSHLTLSGISLMILFSRASPISYTYFQLLSRGAAWRTHNPHTTCRATDSALPLVGRNTRLLITPPVPEKVLAHIWQLFFPQNVISLSKRTRRDRREPPFCSQSLSNQLREKRLLPNEQQEEPFRTKNTGGKQIPANIRYMYIETNIYIYTRKYLYRAWGKQARAVIIS